MDVLEKMTTFVRVVEAGNLSKASQQLGVSGAAVSRQLATLEASLRITLINRTTRRMTVTEAGQRYYEQCLRILRDVDVAQSIGQRALEGPLKINAPVSYGQVRVAPELPAFMKKHPALRIDLRIEDRLSDLVLDDVDVAIRVGAQAPDSTSVVAQTLTSFRRVLVASPAYLRRRGTPKTLEALRRHAALHTGYGPRDTWLVNDAQVPIDVAFSCNAVPVLREMALADAGLAMLPDWFVASDLAARRLKRVLPEFISAPVPVLALYRTRHRSEPRVRALIDHLESAWRR